jgi:hypothetical protein
MGRRRLISTGSHPSSIIGFGPEWKLNAFSRLWKRWRVVMRMLPGKYSAREARRIADHSREAVMGTIMGVRMANHPQTMRTIPAIGSVTIVGQRYRDHWLDASATDGEMAFIP